MSNFSFLKRYGQELEEDGLLAEENLYRDQDGCVHKLRKLAEGIAKRVTTEKRLDGRRNKLNSSIKATFDEDLFALKNAQIVPSVIMDDFYLLKKKGNDGSHPNGDEVTLDDAERAMRAAHRVSVWFVRDYKDRKEEIPGFVLPEENTNSKSPSADSGFSVVDGIRKVIDSPLKRRVASVAAAFGLIWLWEIYKDPEHRWHVALVRTVRIIVFALILALLALPFFILANGITIWQAYHLFVSSIAQNLGWNEYRIQALGLILLLPFLSAVRLAFSWNVKRRLAGMAVLIAMAISYNLMFYNGTKNIFFIPGTGEVAQYYERTDEGCIFYGRNGYSPTTGRPLVPVTPDVVRACKIEHVQGANSMDPVDPATHDWFNPNSGLPMLWYSRTLDGKLDFFLRPGTNPRTGDSVMPVTRELEQSWTKASTPTPPTPKGPRTQEDILSEILHPAASGGPGVLLMDVTAKDQSGVDALNLHLSGVNTSSFPAEVLERRGFAGKFYQGDPSLIRKALSITHLNSLVIAEVKTDCTKRSSLDPDLLSCDLTANARRFDAQGNQAGSRMVQATGAGFNESAALEEAAKRASASLLAFAKR